MICKKCNTSLSKKLQFCNHCGAKIGNPGRNELCWCGSKKKYKKCHFDSDSKKNLHRPVGCKNSSDISVANNLIINLPI